MTLIKTTLAAAICTVCATAALSADYQISRSLELTAPAAEVWGAIGDFCDIDDWHPGISDCALKADGGAITRVITTAAGERHVHRRIATEPGVSYTYAGVSTPLQVENLVATLSIEPFAKPLVAWSVRFSSDDPAAEAAIVAEIEAGLAAIAQLME